MELRVPESKCPTTEYNPAPVAVGLGFSLLDDNLIMVRRRPWILNGDHAMKSPATCALLRNDHLVLRRVAIKAMYGYS